MTTTDRSHVGAILLAAGASRGLGHPKQLVVYEAQTLIRRAAERLASSKAEPIIVVLGAEIERCKMELRGLDVDIFVNGEWSIGISSSIACGLRGLLDASPDADGALIALCDQPFVATDDYDRLLAKFAETRSPIVASAYEGVIGVPAVFAKEIFDDLFELRGDEGARFLMRKDPGRTSAVPIAGASFDVDEPKDLEVIGIHREGECDDRIPDAR